MTLLAEAIATRDGAGLLAALTASAGYSDAPFTLALSDDSSTLLLDWKDWGAVADLATLRTEQPTLDDLSQAGLQIQARANQGATATNAYAVLTEIEGLASTVTVDSANVTATLNSLTTEVNAGIASQTSALSAIDTYADSETTAPTVATYKLAGVEGVTEGNLTALNVQVKAVATGDANTIDKIEAIVATADALLAAFETNTPANANTGFTVAEYEAIGITGVEDTAGSDNLAAVNAQVALAAAGEAERGLDLALLVAKADAAIAKIEAYNNGTGTLTVEDYAAAGITGVTSTTLYAVNAEIAHDGNQQLDSVSDIQTLVDKGIQASTDARDFLATYAGDSQSFASLSGTATSFVPEISSTTDPDAAGIIADNFDYDTNLFGSFKAFDGNKTTGTNSGAHSTLLGGNKTATLGWRDTSANPKLGLLQSIEIIERATQVDRVPGQFEVQGYDAVSQSWQTIGSYANTTTGALTINTNQLTVSKPYDAYSNPIDTLYSGFRLVIKTSQSMAAGGSDAYININELVFNAKSPIDGAFKKPLISDLLTAGLVGVDASNYQAILRYLDNQTSQTDPAALVAELNPLIANYENTVVNALTLTDDTGYVTGEVSVTQVTDDTQPLLKGTTANLDTLTAPRLKISLNDTYVGDASLAGDGSWQFQFTQAIPEGNSNLLVELVDGGVGASGGQKVLGAVTTIVLSVDLTPPAVGAVWSTIN
jgi:hypothetical protein